METWVQTDGAFPGWFGGDLVLDDVRQVASEAAFFGDEAAFFGDEGEFAVLAEEAAVRVAGGPAGSTRPKHYFQKSFDQLAREAHEAIEAAAALELPGPRDDIVGEDAVRESSLLAVQAMASANRIQELLAETEGRPEPARELLLAELRIAEAAARVIAQREQSIATALAAALLLWY